MSEFQIIFKHAQSQCRNGGGTEFDNDDDGGSFVAVPVLLIPFQQTLSRPSSTVTFSPRHLDKTVAGRTDEERKNSRTVDGVLQKDNKDVNNGLPLASQTH